MKFSYVRQNYYFLSILKPSWTEAIRYQQIPFLKALLQLRIVKWSEDVPLQDIKEYGEMKA